MAVTRTGTGTRGGNSGTPTCPLSFLPQHHSDPPGWSPQVWIRPAVTAVQFAVDDTGSGESRVVVVPSPSCPLPLNPQHQRLGVLRMAQV